MMKFIFYCFLCLLFGGPSVDFLRVCIIYFKCLIYMVLKLGYIYMWVLS